MFMQKQAGNTSIYVFALAVMCVFLALAALYESWSLPLAVILVVPLCLLCSVVWSAVDASRRQYLRANRADRAGRPGLQERDSDRRVRQANARDEGKPVFDATQEASRLRLRPILMTSFAFIFGVIPLVRGQRGRGRDAAFAGDRRVQRHAGGHAVRHFSHARVLLRDPRAWAKPRLFRRRGRCAGSARRLAGASARSLRRLSCWRRSASADASDADRVCGHATGVLIALTLVWKFASADIRITSTKESHRDC